MLNFIRVQRDQGKSPRFSSMGSFVETSMSSEHENARREQAVRERARLIWEGRGRPDGKDIDIWLMAEAEIDYELPRSWADAVKDSAVRKTRLK
jgi:hypothetical protein